MTPAEYQTLTGAPSAQMADLHAFVDRLTEANAVMNLVGPDSLPDVWNRHIWDSAQLMEMKPHAKTWADLGAGAGFPGVVLAILLKIALDELERSDKSTALITLCIGGGMGTATVIERV